jgi:hypothetical protein
VPEYLYDIAIEAPDGQIKIDWGHTPGWMETHRALLDTAERVSLLPKDPAVGLPLISTQLQPGQRWVLFSRVYGQVTGGQQVRLYCIGWQQTIGGKSVKALTWVYPNGVIENGNEPTYWLNFL